MYTIYTGGLQELKKDNENMFAMLYFLYKLNIIWAKHKWFLHTLKIGLIFQTLGCFVHPGC